LYGHIAKGVSFYVDAVVVKPVDEHRSYYLEILIFQSYNVSDCYGVASLIVHGVMDLEEPVACFRSENLLFTKK